MSSFTDVFKKFCQDFDNDFLAEHLLMGASVIKY